jgi:uncharacterized protein with HEPN domain
MIEAAEEAKRDSTVGKGLFLQPGPSQKSILLDLIHLTESADRTSPGLKRLNPQVPWERLSRLRNRGLVHDYGDIDLEDLWMFVKDELPRIRRLLDHIHYPREDVDRRGD